MPQAIPAIAYYAATYLGATELVATAIAIAASAATADYQRHQANRKADAAFNASLQDRLVMAATTDGPRSRVYGRVRNCDGVLFKATSGEDSRYYTLVVALAGHEIDAIETVYFDDQAVTLGTADADGWQDVLSSPYAPTSKSSKVATCTVVDGHGSVTLPFALTPGTGVVASTGGGESFQEYFADVTVDGLVATIDNAPADGVYLLQYQTTTTAPKAKVRKHLGAPGQDLSASLVARFPSLITSTDKFQGIACLEVQLEYDKDAFPASLPNISAVIRGAKVYDPRTGLTAWTENNALIARDWAIYPYGGGLPASVVDDSSVIVAANACDVTHGFTVKTKSGGTSVVTRPMYTCGIVARTDVNPAATFDAIIMSMAGGHGWATGKLRIKAGAYRAPSLTIDESWLSGAGGIEIVPEPSLDEAINIVRPTIADAAQGYVSTPTEEVRAAAYVELDGEDLPKDLTMPAVTSAVQAAHVGGVIMRDARSGLVATLPCNLRGLRLTLFDTVYVDLPRLGFDGKEFEVVDWLFSMAGGTVPVLKETAASIFDPDAEFTESDATPNTQLPDPFRVPTITGLAASSGTDELIKQADGTIVSRILVQWSDLTDAAVTTGGTVEVRYWPSSSSDSKGQSIFVPGADTQAYIPGVKDGSSYIIKARAANSLVRGDWSKQLQHKVVGKTAPPSDVGAFSYEIEQFSIRLEWDEISDADRDSYEIRVGASWSNSTKVATVRGASYKWGPQAVASYQLWIKAIDTTKHYSTNAKGLAVVVGAPSAPDGLTATIDGKDLVLAWSAPDITGSAISEYEVRYGGSSWSTATLVQRVKATSLRLPVQWSGSRTYRVAAVAPPNNVGAQATAVVVIASPGPVTAARAEVIDNNVLLYWSAPASGTLPVVRYEIRKGASWAAGTPIGSNADSTFTPVFEQVSGTFNYWITAFDSANNQGTPLAITATVSQPPDYVLRVNYDDDFVGGTHSGTYVDAGAVCGPSFGETIQTHFESRGWTTVNDQIAAGYPLFFEPSSSSGYYERTIDYGALLPSTTITVTPHVDVLAGAVTSAVQIYYKASSADPFTAATAGALQVVASDFRYVKVRVTYTASGGDDLAAMDRLNIKLSSKLRNDSGTASAVSTDSGGTTVSFNVAFIDVTSIVVTPLGTTARYAIVNFVDAPNPTTFKVLLFDSAGNRLSGDFTWTARGY